MPNIYNCTDIICYKLNSRYFEEKLFDWLTTFALAGNYWYKKGYAKLLFYFTMFFKLFL